MADAYDRLEMLTTPMENHLARFYQSSIAKDLEDNYQRLLYIATKLQTKWLFREVICRIIPSEHYSKFKYFSERTALAVKTLFTEKRGELPKSTMIADHKLLMLKPPKVTTKVRHQSSMNGAMAALRNLLYEHLWPYDNEAFPNNSSMQCSYRKYQILREALMIYIPK